MRNASEALKQTLLPLLAVAGAVGLLALLVYFIRNWWRDNDGPAVSTHEMLADYRELHRRGELSDEEYRIIKGRMASTLGAAPRTPEEPPGQPNEELGKE